MISANISVSDSPNYWDIKVSNANKHQSFVDMKALLTSAISHDTVDPLLTELQKNTPVWELLKKYFQLYTNIACNVVM
jgi:hypothetical protein